MPAYRKFTLAVTAIAVIFLVTCLLIHPSFWSANIMILNGFAILFLLWLATVLTMAFLPCSGFYFKVFCNGSSGKKSVAITFDDGPDPVHTARIAAELNQLGVSATFFLIGSRIAGNEERLRSLHSEGHLLGNHSFGHEPWFDLLPTGRMKDGILETNRLVREATGLTPRMFRPPFGVTNPMVAKAVRLTGMVPVCWSIRSLDTLNRDPEVTLNRILNRLKPGTVILLHDHSRFSASHIGALVTGIRNSGYAVVPLSELLNINCYE